MDYCLLVQAWQPINLTLVLHGFALFGCILFQTYVLYGKYVLRIDTNKLCTWLKFLVLLARESGFKERGSTHADAFSTLTAYPCVDTVILGLA